MTAPVALAHLINGAWTAGVSDTSVISTNPARPEELVALGTGAGPADLDRAVVAARTALPGWAHASAHERGGVLLRAAEIVDAAAQQWGVELAREEGKTLAEAVGEVHRAAQILRYHGNDADRESGKLYQSPRRGERVMVTRKPIGVIGAITPFNFPIAIPAWKIAPALTYGNTVVWKPAGTVPLLAMRLAQALGEAGLPAGVLNLLIGESEIGSGIVEHPGIDAITFTGSTGIGRNIAATAAARGVPVQAEMGGKNAAVVLADADLDLAVEQVMLGAFRSSGQKCTATSRLVLDEQIAEDFLAELGKRATELRVGDPLDTDSDLGPVITDSACTSIVDGVERAVAQGASRLAGGTPELSTSLAGGHFVKPTVLQLDSTAYDVWRDELFGPVLVAVRAHDAEDALTLAADSVYGLSASVFTQDLTLALDAIDSLDVGVLHVNSESAGADPHVPFGGAGKSGLGPHEQGRSAREFFTHTTTVYLRGGMT